MWAWGSNNNGQLGLGNTTDRSSPVQVGALTNWLSVAGGDNTLFGIKTDGTLWSSGHNNNGQLGDGTTTNRSSPIQVGALTTWSSVASKSTHVMAFASV
jgi:alpha-tubulin suppressor-like RCC1 family protein